MAHIDSEELSSYQAYLQGKPKGGVSLKQAKRWMEIQAHLKTCHECQRKMRAILKVEKMEERILDRLTPNSKWDRMIMRMKDSASVFEIRMKNMFASAEINLREAGNGNQWQPVAVRGENSEWEGQFQETEMVLGAAAGGIYLDGKEDVTIAVFACKADGSAGDLLYEGDPQGLEEFDFEAGDYLVVVESKGLDESLDY